MKCRVCLSEDFFKILDFGSMPLINSFLTEKNKPEMFYPLKLIKCNKCHLVQIEETVDPEILFKDYVYVPSSSNTILDHFKDISEKILKLKKNPFVVEIASNDGSLLKNFLGKSKLLGVEPATNIAKIAESKNIPTLNKFFNLESAEFIKKKYGKPDIIIGTNVLAHVPEIRDFVKAIKLLLSDNGFCLFESPYLIDLIEKTAFDTIYHEHVFYLSIMPLKKLFEDFDLEIFNVERTTIHGGSFQIYIQHKKGPYKIEESVKNIIIEEIKKGYDKQEVYLSFSEKVNKLKNDLNLLLYNLKKQKKKIAGYGASAKGNVLLNYFGIGSNYIEYIVDKNPLKQNKFTPGKRIPVYPIEYLKKETPDYILILIWTLAEEVIKQEKWFKEQKGKFIIPIHKVTYI